MNEIKKIKCAVIGANGYIGRHLTYLLNRRGFDVSAYGNNDVRNITIPKEVSYKKVDVTSQHDIKKIDFDVEYLFLFAGLTGTLDGFNNYKNYLNVNELGLLNLLDALKGLNKKPHCIFPSSRLVYKGSSFPLKENDEKEAKTIYAANKISGEYYLSAYSNMYKIPYTIFRICVPYGNLFDDCFSFGTIGNFINKAKNKQNIILYGNGELRRTFTYIESVCEQIINSLDNDKIINEIFNISGEAYSLKDVAQLIAHKYGVEVEYIQWPEDNKLIESGDTVFDSSKLMNIIGQENTYSLKDVIFT